MQKSIFIKNRNQLNKMKAQSFGSKNAWLAIKSTNRKLVINSLAKIFEVDSTINWEEGVKKGYYGDFFLTPGIDGWIFLVSSELFQILNDLQDLSKELGDVQFYATHRGNNYIEIRRYLDGREIRVLKCSDGELIKESGDPSSIELSIAKGELEESLEDVKDDKELYEYYQTRPLLSYLGSEKHVFLIAENWSLNPQKLNEYDSDELGEILIKK